MAPKSNLCKYIDVYVNLLSQNAFIGALLIALHSLFHLYIHIIHICLISRRGMWLP